MKNLRRKILIILSILIVFCITILIYMFRINNNVKNNDEPIIVLDSITTYEYSLEDRDTELFKSIFNQLKETLNEEEINFTKYAELLGKLYIIDLYTLDNKLNQYDVGASEFIFPEIKENYELKVKDTLYKYIEDNSNGERKQNLPVVSDIELNEIKENTFNIGENKYDAYELNLSWNYEKDLGYDKECTLIIINVEQKLYVAEQK